MEEELNLDLDKIEAQAEEKLKVKNRFEKLSEKVILEAKAKEEAEAKVKTEAEARLQAERERDFYKDFSKNLTKYPTASEYQDKIWEKVRGGYTTEDATLAILAKEGKLSASAPEAPKPEPEGGSAPTVVPGDKTLEDMSVDEKWKALEEAEKKGELETLLKGFVQK